MEAIDGSASPRNPSVPTRSRSSKLAILLVACAAIASVLAILPFFPAMLLGIPLNEIALAALGQVAEAVTTTAIVTGLSSLVPGLTDLALLAGANIVLGILGMFAGLLRDRESQAVAVWLKGHIEPWFTPHFDLVGLAHGATQVIFEGSIDTPTTLVGGDTTNVGTLDVDETWTYAASYTLTQADLDDGDNIDNIATAVTDQTPPESDDATVPVDALADISGRKFGDLVRDANGGAPIDVVVSSVGRDLFARMIDLLGPGGRLVFYGATSGYTLTFLGKTGAAPADEMLRRAGLRPTQGVLVYWRGADDAVTHDDGSVEVVTAPELFADVRAAMIRAGLTPEFADVTERAAVAVPLAGEDAERLLKLVEVLEDLDDVQHVYSNADLPEEVLEGHAG